MTERSFARNLDPRKTPRLIQSTVLAVAIAPCGAVASDRTPDNTHGDYLLKFPWQATRR